MFDFTLGTQPISTKGTTDLGGNEFVPSVFRSNQVRFVRLLDAHQDRRPFVGQRWVPVADLEYLSKGVLDLKGYVALNPKDLGRRFLIVTIGRFDNVDDRPFMSLVSRCGAPILSNPPYADYECGGETLAP